MRQTGDCVPVTAAGEAAQAFIPRKLPPADPVLSVSGALAECLAGAEDALARLDGVADWLPSIEWCVYGFVRKEAVFSSGIEGTQATIVDLLAYEAQGQAEDVQDVTEVCNYFAALEHALARLEDPKGLPISLRLFSEMHAVLMRGVRGADNQPGVIRRSQNWIGGRKPSEAVLVPPPPEKVGTLLDDLERYIHGEDELPDLVRVALVHAQFETIHPYLDGNGRLGRLLITLMLEHFEVFSARLLYLSLFFQRNRDEYYRRLSAVRNEGDWEGWVAFFLQGITEIAGEAESSIKHQLSLFEWDRRKLLGLPKASMPAVRLLDRLQSKPIVSVASASEVLGVTLPTARKAIAQLSEIGVLVEGTGRLHNRFYSYRAYLDLLKS